MAVMLREDERKGREEKGRTTKKMLFAFFYIQDFCNDSYSLLFLIPWEWSNPKRCPHFCSRAPLNDLRWAPSFIQSQKYLLNVYYVPDSGVTMENKVDFDLNLKVA